VSGGVRSLADLRARCRVDDETGCWRWSLSCLPAGVPVVWLPPDVLGRARGGVVCGPLAARLLGGFARPPRGSLVVAVCGTRDCVCPAHVREMTRPDFGRWIAGTGRWRGVPARAQVNRSTGRSGSTMTLDDARAIRSAVAAGATQRAVAARFGVSRSVVWRVVHGVAWAETITGASVFSPAARDDVSRIRLRP
jgi:predicted DNA-binding protein (UPF0251 family)